VQNLVDFEYVRYLVARSWNLDKAKAMLRETLDWRIKFQADEITGTSVFENGKTGKVFVSGIDLQVPALIQS
jgi:hypothetical protein